MLTFVGLGLYDERSITVEGKEAIATADRVFAEFYTSKLAGSDLQRLSYYHGAEFELLDRAGVEREPEPILEAAEDGEVVFATAGDPMIATTHVDLRLRAEERDITTRIVHGTTAQAAAASVTGLQNYCFGKATTLPFPDAHGDGQVPDSVVATVEDNAERGLHTLVFLDIKVDDPAWEGTEEFMGADDAAALLSDPLGEDRLGVGVARAGSANPKVVADRLEALAATDFGRELHLLVVPGDLDPLEADALATFGDAPAAVLDDARE